MENLNKSFIIRNKNVIGMDVQRVYASTPIGIIQPFASDTNIPRGYLLCNGASYKVADYPDLYAVIGNTYGGDSTNFNVPDYRETVLVGVGENTTDTIASHDVYELGEFKDDQLQNHYHNLSRTDTGASNLLFYQNNGEGEDWHGALTTTVTGKTATIITTSEAHTGRGGTTTHGKQKGVTYIIKAFHTNEGMDSGVSDDVINYVETELVDLGGREQSVTFPFTPTANGTLILTIGQKSVDPVTRGVNVIENGENFYYVNNYFGGTWGAFSASIPLVKDKTYIVEDTDDVIMYEKTKFIY